MAEENVVNMDSSDPAANEMANKAHEEQMVKVADGEIPAGTPPAETVAERPANIPEKFWDAEKGVANVDAMAASYAELEKNRGKPAEADESLKPAADEGDLGIPEQTGDQLMDQLSDEFDTNGGLSDESYTKIETQMGFNREFVDNYIAGQKARVAEFQNQAYEIVGGEDAYKAQISWASVNLDATQQAALNANLNSSDIEAVKLGVTALNQHYTAANGTTADIINGGGDSSTGQGYRSWAEVTAAMSDPRYNKDPAYRQDVEKKVHASKL